jgi:heme a synthase
LVNLIRRYHWITLFLTGLTLLVVTVGAYTRLSDAGLGCPDWPGCYGSLLVPDEVHNENVYAHIPLEADKAWIEMFHRYIAGILGLAIFTLTLLAYTRMPVLQQIRGLLGFTTLLIGFQAILGMWTVTWLLHPTIVMLHLLGGMATLSLVWLMNLRIRAQATLKQSTLKQPGLWLKIAASIGLIIVVLQIALGGWVSTNYAAFACPDFPTCQATWWPSLDWEAFNIFIPIDRNFSGGFLDHPARVTIHFIHRIGALVTTIYLLLFGSYCLYAVKGRMKILIVGLWLVLLLQLLLGIINVVALLPLWAAVLHNGVAAILLLFMVTINYRLYKS